MKRDGLLVALCAVVLASFFSFSLGVHWDASRWDTASRVRTERNDPPAPPVGEEDAPPEETPVLEETPAAEEPLAPETPAGEETDQKVNINTADKETLMTLPGVGEARAQAILDDRAANGPFRHPEDITRVSGIGEALMEGMLDQITTEREDDP